MRGGDGHDNIMTRIAVGPFTLSSVIQQDIFVLRKTEDSLYNNIYQYLDNFYCISTRYARVRSLGVTSSSSIITDKLLVLVSMQFALYAFVNSMATIHLHKISIGLCQEKDNTIIYVSFTGHGTP